MSKSRQGRSAADRGSSAVNGGLLMAAVSVTSIGLLAASTLAAVSTAATASAAGPVAVAPAPSPTIAFVPIVELFDPGHPAHAVPAPANCDQDSTLAIERCFERKTQTVDAAIDAVRQAGFASASAARRDAINAEDSGWLAARQTVCGKAYQTGGTIDGINIASCLLDESTARLDAVNGITPPEAVLKATDSTGLSNLFWYTTPEGSRIAMSDTQGDASGGVIIAWVIIAGADGFTVNPAQFFYRDGVFTDAGTVQGPNPSGHRVAPGTEYQFSIDYGHLPADPHAGKGSGGWVYSPGMPVAVWR